MDKNVEGPADTATLAGEPRVRTASDVLGFPVSSSSRPFFVIVALFLFHFYEPKKVSEQQ